MPDTKTRRNVILGVLALGVVAGAALVVMFFTGDAPDAATLEGAVAVAQQEQSGTADVDGGDPGTASDTTVAAATDSEDASVESGDAQPVDAGVDGTWTVDTSVGEFSYENATSTFVGFRIGEELASIGRTEAVGRTPVVTGTIEISGSTLSAATIEADFTEITTETSRRDGAVQRALDTDAFPTATFALTGPVDFGDVPADGAATAVTAMGDLTVHGVTQTVEFPLEAQVVGDLIVVVGQIEVVLEDYDVSVPSAPAVLSANDFATVEVQLFFSR